MARRKSTESIEKEITNVKTAMSKLQDRYDKLADQLKALEEQKLKAEAVLLWKRIRRVARASMR